MGKPEDDDEDEATMQEQYDMMANATSEWLNKAAALFTAGDVLFKLYESTRPGAKARRKTKERFFHDLCVIKMLRGMGIECLLKAVWVDQGEVMGKSGKFVKSLNANSHDLYAIARVVCEKSDIRLSDEEGHMLARLAFTIEMGRYPVSTSFNKFPSKPGIQPTYFYAWQPKDESLFQAFVTKLTEKIVENNKSV